MDSSTLVYRMERFRGKVSWIDWYHVCMLQDVLNLVRYLPTLPFLRERVEREMRSLICVCVCVPCLLAFIP